MIIGYVSKDYQHYVPMSYWQVRAWPPGEDKDWLPVDDFFFKYRQEEVIQIIIEPKELAEWEVVLDRAMSTWEPRFWPAWLSRLDFLIKRRLGRPVPEPATRPSHST